MCTVLLPPGDNPISVNKYINISIKHHIIKMYRRVEIQLHAFLISALDGGGQLHPLVTLPLGGQPDTHSIEDRVCSRAGRKLWRG